MLVASLARSPGTAVDSMPTELNAIAANLSMHWPGYGLEFAPDSHELPPQGRWRLCFVHDLERSAELRIFAEESTIAEQLAVRLGDAFWLAPGEHAQIRPALDLLAFAVPDGPGKDCPPVLRPDFDPRLTDTPGGCATATDAYRRVMLTWLERNGPYTARSINCHRVRMTDSFSHYHPREGGFEELYLVHEVSPGGCILWSSQVAAIEARAAADPATARAFIQRFVPAAGDLVFIPRGTMHRAIGGVLAHVVTIPGFVPAREIGLDHHLRAISEGLGMRGDDALPYHVAASFAPMVK
ncbi:MAG: hypothetical protein AB7I19_15275 [Planctomycetota bacterium]